LRGARSAAHRCFGTIAAPHLWYPGSSFPTPPQPQQPLTKREPRVISQPISASRGYSLTETQRLLRLRFHRDIPVRTVSSWLTEYRPLTTYARLRSAGRKHFSPDTVIRSHTFHRQQVYRFRVHRAKLELLTQANTYPAAGSTTDFTGLKEYLASIGSPRTSQDHPAIPGGTSQTPRPRSPQESTSSSGGQDTRVPHSSRGMRRRLIIERIVLSLIAPPRFAGARFIRILRRTRRFRATGSQGRAAPAHGRDSRYVDRSPCSRTHSASPPSRD